MPEDVIEAIGALVAGHRRFAVAGHRRPDGDAIGSSVALGECLRAAGKDVTVLNEDGVPENLAFLPASGEVKRPGDLGGPLEVDGFFVVDTATHDRIGAGVLGAVRSPVLVNIDHHASNPRFGDINHIDPSAPAVGQIIFEAVRALGLPLPPAARDNLFAAISTDTGSFQYPGTNAETYRMAAELVELGADTGRISQLLYENYPLRRVELLRTLLNRMRLGAGGRLASWSLPRESAAALGLGPSDAEGLIDTIRSIDSVIVAVYLEEQADGRVRASVRSKSRAVDVGKLCARFDGGGHPLAAGARLPGPLAAAEAGFLEAAEGAIAAAFPDAP
jgi:phosphoesterase RecJ-like protein